MSDEIDWKYRIQAVNPCKTGSVYTEHHGVFFKAADAGIIPMLGTYLQFCINTGTGPEHIEAIRLLIGRVAAYQQKYGSKIPDTDLPCEIDRCVGGILDE